MAIWKSLKKWANGLFLWVGAKMIMASWHLENLLGHRPDTLEKTLPEPEHSLDYGGCPGCEVCDESCKTEVEQIGNSVSAWEEPKPKRKRNGNRKSKSKPGRKGKARRKRS